MDCRIILVAIISTILGCSQNSPKPQPPGAVGQYCGEERVCLQELVCLENRCCSPSCREKECGDDGCGGSCGSDCGLLSSCIDGKCKCEFDSCKDSCCNTGEICTDSGCCMPTCDGVTCGPDGCGGSCGECESNEKCEDGACSCAVTKCQNTCCQNSDSVCYFEVCCDPDCGGKQCGTDGCGGSCGICEESSFCSEEQCVCKNEMCGDNCCSKNEICFDGSCCLPDCENKICGSDGCGGSCGNCEQNFVCLSSGGYCACETFWCSTNCCNPDQVCHSQKCCTPDCDQKQCGYDGCGGLCPSNCVGQTRCGSEYDCIEVSWLVVVGDAFTMGSPAVEAGSRVNEVPHQVTLTYSYLMKDTPVTQSEFALRMGYNPTSFDHHLDCGHDCPVVNVSWHEAAKYCNKLSNEERLPICYECVDEQGSPICRPSLDYNKPYLCTGYRLPTEAEWEYAARAGTQTATYNGDLKDNTLLCEMPNEVLDSIAWFCGNSDTSLQLVAQKNSNDIGLFDMLGLVWEWTNDWYGEYPEFPVNNPAGPATGDKKTLRGGDVGAAENCRAARRVSSEPSEKGSSYGFRLVRSLVSE